tara:strand:+ start:1972 stop:2184 length:213 start_codon:yes stop_codon:yes gene_type:complete
MAVSPKIQVIGPFSPADFSPNNLGTYNTAGSLSKALTDAAASTPGSTLVAAEPITVLGNVYLILSLTGSA